MSLLLPSEIAKFAAEAGGKTHAEAMKILKKENPDWPEGDLADAANSVSPSMGADARRVQKRYQALTKSASTESPMMLPSELARLGKFPAGVSMTIDEVAAVVGDSFKEMNENPPPEVVALREEMMDKTAAVSEADLFEAVKSAKKVGQKIRNVKDAAWKQAIRVGYIQLNGMRFELTPIGEIYFESMAGRPGFTRWAEDEEKVAAKRKMPAADMALVVKGKFPNAFVQLSGLFGDGAEDITAAVDGVAGFTGGRASVSDEAEAKSLMEKVQKELSKNKTFKVSMTKDILDLPELSIKWAGKTARFEEGPAGEKEFDAWLSRQPQSVQDDWKENTDKYEDKFKNAGLLPSEIAAGLKEARFHEGPKGAKQFEAWMKTQPQSVQDDWASNTEKYKDKFKTASEDAVLIHCSQLAGDLNSEWDKVVRAHNGAPDEAEVNRLASIIEDLEMDILTLRRFQPGSDGRRAAEKSAERIRQRTTWQRLAKFGPYTFDEMGLKIAAETSGVTVTCGSGEIEFKSPAEYLQFAKGLSEFAKKLEGMVSKETGSAKEGTAETANFTPADPGAPKLAGKVYGHLEWHTAADSGPAARFFRDNPERREVSEVARGGTPPTPTEIQKQPMGDQLSTLNRFVVKVK